MHHGSLSDFMTANFDSLIPGGGGSSSSPMQYTTRRFTQRDRDGNVHTQVHMTVGDTPARSYNETSHLYNDLHTTPPHQQRREREGHHQQHDNPRVSIRVNTNDTGTHHQYQHQHHSQVSQEQRQNQPQQPQRQAVEPRQQHRSSRTAASSSSAALPPAQQEQIANIMNITGHTEHHVRSALRRVGGDVNAAINLLLDYNQMQEERQHRHRNQHVERHQHHHRHHNQQHFRRDDRDDDFSDDSEGDDMHHVQRALAGVPFSFDFMSRDMHRQMERMLNQHPFMGDPRRRRVFTAHGHGGAGGGHHNMVTFRGPLGGGGGMQFLMNMDGSGGGGSAHPEMFMGFPFAMHRMRVDPRQRDHYDRAMAAQYERLLQLDRGNVSRGITEETLDKVTRQIQYDEAIHNKDSGNGREAIDACVICQDDFTQGETVIELPRCGHLFHRKCLVPWVAKQRTCPTCRKEICDRADRN